MSQPLYPFLAIYPQGPICFLYHELFLFVCFCFFAGGGFTCMRDNMLFVFLWLTYFSYIMSLRSIRVVTNGKISFYCIHSVQLPSRVRLFAIPWIAARQDSTVWLSNIPLCIYTTFCLSFKLSMDTYLASISWLL